MEYDELNTMAYMLSWWGFFKLLFILILFNFTVNKTINNNIFVFTDCIVLVFVVCYYLWPFINCAFLVICTHDAIGVVIHDFAFHTGCACKVFGAVTLLHFQPVTYPITSCWNTTTFYTATVLVLVLSFFCCAIASPNSKNVVTFRKHHVTNWSRIKSTTVVLLLYIYMCLCVRALNYVHYLL